MKLLFLGDVMGRSGRRSVCKNLPILRREWNLDFVVINAENATDGAGLSEKHARLLLNAGADVLTLGDHAFDRRDMLSFIEVEPRILRPLNYALQAPGHGARLYKTVQGKKVFVAQALGQIFMKRPFSNPFSILDLALKKALLGTVATAVIIDFHAEATSEKMAMGHWLDGRASLVVGTHTHVPTADTRILPLGTAAQSDAGMCGDYNSVIGMEKNEPINRFVTGMARQRYKPAKGLATLCGVLLQTDDKTGLATSIRSIRIDGCLQQSL